MKKLLPAAAFLLILSQFPVVAQDFTILHTNDLHSRFLGWAPALDYTPHITGDDDTLGGMARIKTAVDRIRDDRTNPVFLLDAGDFSMGTAFHLFFREEAYELSLMKIMGYDAVALGNHEFDLKPDGLAAMLNSAAGKDGLPSVVASNVVFDPAEEGDDTLEDAFRRELAVPWKLLRREGLTVGIFSLIGRDAADVSPFASPVSFADPVETAKEMVRLLREDQGADVVVCLSHSGVREEPDLSEDEILAEEVAGIDVIVSGHTHTALSEPLVRNGTLIVQTGSFGENLGVLDMTFRDGRVSMKEYRLIPIDDSIPGDPEITALIEGYKHSLADNFFSGWTDRLNGVIAETAFDLNWTHDESNMGNLIADSILWNIRRLEPSPEGAPPISLESNGLIRDSLLRGETGRVAVSDLFRAFPLGFGPDTEPGYPILKVYLSAAEIRKVLEVVTTIAPMKGEDYFLHFGGIRFSFNPLRLPFDRVTRVEILTGEAWAPLDCSGRNRTLYPVYTNLYNASMISVIGKYTFNILNVVIGISGFFEH